MQPAYVGKVYELTAGQLFPDTRHKATDGFSGYLGRPAAALPKMLHQQTVVHDQVGIE